MPLFPVGTVSNSALPTLTLYAAPSMGARQTKAPPQHCVSCESKAEWDALEAEVGGNALGSYRVHSKIHCINCGGPPPFTFS